MGRANRFKSGGVNETKDILRQTGSEAFESIPCTFARSTYSYKRDRMITIFTTPKPFRGRIADIQINSLKSWKLLHPDVEVIIFGTEEGTAEIARDLGLVHIARVETGAAGMPLVDSMFGLAAQHGRHDMQCYANADILFLSDLIETTKRVSLRRFLLVGQRWDLDLTELIDFDSEDWREELLKRSRREGVRHPPAGSDYFVFRRGTLGTIPPMSVGRPRWDNGMIFHARLHRVPVIDCSPVITLIHQNHPPAYDDLSTGGTGDLETQRNLELVPTKQQFTLVDTDWVWTRTGIAHKKGWGYFLNSIHRFPVLHPRLKWSSPITEWLLFHLGNLPPALSHMKNFVKAEKGRNEG